jgi:hypothetical protein
MEETLKSLPVIPLSKTTFTEIWGETWRVYKLKFPIITAILLIPGLMSLAINIYGSAYIYKYILSIADNNLSSEQIGAMLLPLFPAIFGATFLFAIIAMVISYFTSGTVLRIANHADDGKSAIGPALHFVLSRLGTSIGLYFRILFYTLVRVLIPIGILLVLSILKSLIPGNSDMYGMNILFPFLVFIAITAMIVLMIQAALRVSFTYSLLFMGEKPSTSKEIFQKSLDLSQNLLWRIFANYFLLTLIFFLIGTVYGGILAVSFPQNAAVNPLLFMPQSTTYQDEISTNEAGVEAPRPASGNLTPEAREQLTAQFKEGLAVNPLQEIALLPLTIIAGGFGLVFRSVFTKKALEEKGLA